MVYFLRECSDRIETFFFFFFLIQGSLAKNLLERKGSGNLGFPPDLRSCEGQYMITTN